MKTRYYWLLSGLISSMAAAEEQQPKIEDLSLMQVVLPLLLVIILIFLLAWLVKKVNPGTPSLGQGITVIANTPLSSHARVCLIRVGDKDILLGVTSQQVTQLHTFEEPPVSLPKNENAHNFADQFKSILQGRKKNTDSTETE